MAWLRADALRSALDAYVGVPGAKRLVGLSLPLTGEMVNGFEVDFFWPELKLLAGYVKRILGATAARLSRIHT